MDQLNRVRGERKPARCHLFTTVTLTLKLDWDLVILKAHLHTENGVARSIHSNVIAEIHVSTKIALKVKGQGQMLPTFNHF